MSSCEIDLSDIGSGLVSFVSGLGCCVALLTCGILCNVTVIVTLPTMCRTNVSRNQKQIKGVCITLHLVVEHLSFALGGGGNQELLQESKNVVADIVQLGLDLFAVLLDLGNLGLVALAFFLLLDRRYDSPGRTACTNHVLVRDREKVALFDGQIHAHLSETKKVVNKH